MAVQSVEIIEDKHVFGIVPFFLYFCDAKTDGGFCFDFTFIFHPPFQERPELLIFLNLKYINKIFMDFKIYKSHTEITDEVKSEVIDFLFNHLDQYRDNKEDIEKAIDFALGKSCDLGGYVLTGREGGEMVGVVVVNRTGMEGYIPENILVYIAVDNRFRGKGYGKMLMKEAINNAEGNVALHVEPDNPARYLYEKLGFTSKYLEMRYVKSR